ncbi:MAG: UDP-N-acetylmuramoyl-tripeptide--D-alanyl-D-alanine ligase [Clostridia bacterium]|nr:UDP-N-acetylmuramoyl-tripeptide--D-alanyl-D-alanine ligase [Clostridia bacterium]
MKLFTAAEAAAITGGRLLCGDGDTEITNLQFDSRQVTEGSLFVPIKGEKTDPHKFIEQCLEKGAATLTEYDAPQGAAKPYIKVEDTRRAMQQLAAYYRSSLDVRVVGITGSVGKTSTKEMVAAALSKGFNVMKTQGNRNSQIGMPMTMFDISSENEIAVIEMGMSEFGEMDRLADIARPDIAVMTNIGKAHIENLKTQENIMSEKLKITKHFDENGLLFLNGDDPLLKTLHGKQPFRTVTFGMDSTNDYYADSVEVDGFSTVFMCHCGDRAVKLTIPALGVHSVMNAVAAFAVGDALGLSEAEISGGLMTYRNAPMRQQIHRCEDLVLIDDSYNASPAAAKASLDVLKSIAPGKTIAVLADMLELGDEAAAEHYGVGKHLAVLGVDALIAIGPLSENTAAGAKENGCPCVIKAGSNNEAFAELSKLVEKDCTVLVKGSRGMHTEEVVKLLLEEHQEQN